MVLPEQESGARSQEGRRTDARRLWAASAAALVLTLLDRPLLIGTPVQAGSTNGRTLCRVQQAV
jgi:hypothetical protein